MQATYQPEHQLNRAIAFTSWEDHAFVYKNAKPIANMTGKRREVVANDTKKNYQHLKNGRCGEANSSRYTAQPKSFWP